MDKRQMRAFEGFAAESGAELLRIATLLTPDPHTAEDVYQETLLVIPRLMSQEAVTTAKAELGALLDDAPWGSGTPSRALCR